MMKKTIITSLLTAIFTIIIMLIIFWWLMGHHNQLTNNRPLIKQHTENLCSAERTRDTLNSGIQNLVNSISDDLSNIYYRYHYPHLNVYVEIIPETLLTLEQHEKYALCEFSIKLTTDYDRSKPLTLDFLKYEVRISDNGQDTIMHTHNTPHDIDIIEANIRKWILYIVH